MPHSSPKPPVEFTTSTGASVFRLPCRVFEQMTGFVYLILGDGRPTLVDAGSDRPECVADIQHGLATIERMTDGMFRAKDVSRILLTHGHLDHVGGVWQLREWLGGGIEVGIHPRDAGAISNRAEWSVLRRIGTLGSLQRFGVPADRLRELVDCGRFSPERFESIPVEIPLEDGLAVDEIHIMHTPGHTVGHVVFRVDDIILSGDHVLSRTVPHVWPESMIPGSGLTRCIESLQRMEQLARATGVSLTLAGHERRITDLPHRISQLLRAHKRRVDRVRELLATSDAPPTIWDLAGRMYPRTLGFAGVLMLTDVAARVEYLHQRGEVAVSNLQELLDDRDSPPRYEVGS